VEEQLMSAVMVMYHGAGVLASSWSSYSSLDWVPIEIQSIMWHRFQTKPVNVYHYHEHNLLWACYWLAEGTAVCRWCEFDYWRTNVAESVTMICVWCFTYVCVCVCVCKHWCVV